MCVCIRECVDSVRVRDESNVVITIHESYMEPFTNMYIRACVLYSHIYMCMRERERERFAM